MMIKKFLQNHHWKILVGAPIIFMVIVTSSSTLGVGSVFLLGTEKSNFVLLNDEVPVMLEISTKSPINAIGGTVTYPPESIQIVGLSRISSVIDLWSEEPSITNAEGTVRFSGGIIGEKAAKPIRGQVFLLSVKPIREGKVTITTKDGQLLANDGEGTNIFSGSNVLTLYVRSQDKPSPDMNGDGALGPTDVNLLYLKTFRSYDPHYDLNNDGRVSWADVKFLVSLL
jgi:hypothetical protein